MAEKNPIRKTDDAARVQARTVLTNARFAAIAFADPESGVPAVTRIALTIGLSGAPVTLISDLSAHTRALRANPDCGLLVGEPGAKGDPLNHPRLSISARAKFLEKSEQARNHYLTQYPRAKRYFDFGDFNLVQFIIRGAALNGGFGRAYSLTGDDLAQPACQACPD
ncbi:MAG: pyridoxamine 5'-phosphate oxidase family protein [Rhodobacteraceae bacterium]|nr:pyridoxamine 5'-phosphate oxidase family protein [Paracoccaceae bacterium]